MNEKQRKKVKYAGNGQAERLVEQHEKAGGVEGIFGEDAKDHDASISKAAQVLLVELKKKFPKLEFRHRGQIFKKEINMKLKSLDPRLGKTLFVENSKIKPDGGIIEVLDKMKNWRVVLVSESKHQGNDIQKIVAGIKQGKKKNQDLMVAGNAVERVHKNILEIRNFMISEEYFPYLVFLQGTNFATKIHQINAPDGRTVEIRHDDGVLNRIDRVTASNYGMEINTNHCKNMSVAGKKIQAASLYFQCEPWPADKMLQVMLEIATTSLEVLTNSNAIENR